MPLNVPTFGGDAIFGIAVSIDQKPNPNAVQTDAFFGVTGELSTAGGARGRTFMIEGCWVEADIPTLNNDELYFLSYADSIARTLIDTRGRTWLNVCFDGVYTPTRPVACLGGWLLKYTAQFRGLS
jgi:hypothetical protein